MDGSDSGDHTVRVWGLVAGATSDPNPRLTG
jgi:hypothetical protein